MAGVRPQADYAYDFLNTKPYGSGRWREGIDIDDAALTIIILLGAIQDLVWGIFRMGWPEWQLEAISGFNASDITDPMVRLTRVGGWGGLESGIVGILLTIYRLARWYLSQPFNGANFQIVFLIGTIGKTGALLTNLSLLGWTFLGPDSPLDNYFLFARALLAVLALSLSLYTYRSSWTWLWDRDVK